MSLIERIKKARESQVEVDGVRFTIRRPAEQEAIHELFEKPSDSEQILLKVSAEQLLSRYVVDWSGIDEADLIPGGSPVPVPFSTELFILWAKDHLKVWNQLSQAIIEAYFSYMAAKDEALGKLKAG